MNTTQINRLRRAAAEASGISQEEVRARVRGLLSVSRCRDTQSKPVFTSRVIDSLYHADKVSRHSK